MESKSSKIKSLKICQTAYLVVGGGYLLLGAGIITGIISTPETSNTMMAGIGCSTVTLVTCGMSYGAQKQIKHISKK